MSDARRAGKHAEFLAAQFLSRQGLSILTTNYSTRYGELDLVAWDAATSYLVFVEVRYRKRANFGSAAETVNEAKQQKLRLAAEHYLQQQQRSDDNCRFDVISMTGTDYQLQWFVNAF